jgi:hypothetical protein
MLAIGAPISLFFPCTDESSGQEIGSYDRNASKHNWATTVSVTTKWKPESRSPYEWRLIKSGKYYCIIAHQDKINEVIFRSEIYLSFKVYTYSADRQRRFGR